MIFQKIRTWIYKLRYLLLALVALIPLFYEYSDKKLESVFSEKNDFQVVLLFIFIILAACFWYIFIYDKSRGFTDGDFVFLIVAFGLAVRLCYVISTGYMSRQHDVGGTNGHLDYIKYLYNEKHLPDFDVSKKWQFYHPPLWHTVCALWLKLCDLLGFAGDGVYESLQCLSLYCSGAIMLISHKLFKLFKLEKTPIYIALGIVAFHPTFIMLSGSINNDVSSLTLALAAVVFAIEWYRKPKIKTIIPIALAIGFSMGFKLSGALVAIGVAMLFAVKFFSKETEKKLPVFGQFCVFGVICVPLALWWEIRNFILYKVPITYVPGLKTYESFEATPQYSQFIGWRSVGERLFDISSVWENGVYPARATESLIDKYGFEYFEHNIPVAAAKSSVFGEYYIGKDEKLGSILAVILFYSAVIIALLSLAGGIYTLYKSVKGNGSYKAFKDAEGYDPMELISTVVYSVVMLFSYVNFCFGYPHYCTMDFRYIALITVLGALHLGLLLRNKKTPKALKIVSALAVALFALSGTVLYTVFI